MDIKTADGVADSHVSYPDGQGFWPAVIFFMDGLGIRPEMRAMARRLAAAGYYVPPLSKPRLSIPARRAASRSQNGVSDKRPKRGSPNPRA